MISLGRAPAGPRGASGALAEQAAADHLSSLGWRILARNLRLGRDEIDLVALEPGPHATLVIIEVRSRTSPAFGSPLESVAASKVARIYRAAARLRHSDLVDTSSTRDAADLSLRVDLVALIREPDGHWRVESHLRGLAPP